jgi:hypothetical protein
MQAKGRPFGENGRPLAKRQSAVCQPDENVAVTSAWRAPADEILAAQFVQRSYQRLAGQEITLISRDDLIA